MTGPEFGKSDKGMGGRPKDSHEGWVDTDAIEAAKLEASVFAAGPNGEGETPKATLRRLFEENSVPAAMQIMKLALMGSTDRVRLDAARYIVDRTLGPVSAIGAGGPGTPNGAGAEGEPEPGTLEHTLYHMEKNIRAAHAEGNFNDSPDAK